MRVRVSDVRALPGLVSHLVGQGFPATAAGDVVEILFPASAAALEQSAELDVWKAANSHVTIVPLPELERA